MAHTAKNKTLGRKAEPRRAMLVGQSNALLKNKRMTTTLAKAKALARFIAPIITRARVRSKKDINHAHRQAFAVLKNKKGVFALFNEILPTVKDRPGGYTRIIKLGQRKGDATYMAFIELVDFNQLFQKAKKGGTRRSRRKKKSAGLGNLAGSVLPQENQLAVATPKKEATLEASSQSVEKAKEETTDKEVKETETEAPSSPQGDNPANS